MAKHAYVYTLTIKNGQQDAMLEGGDGVKAISQATDITIYCPTTMPETVTVQVSPNEDSSESSYGYHNLYASGADVTLVAGKAITLPDVAARALNLHAGSAVGADRVFYVAFKMDVFRAYGG